MQKDLIPVISCPLCCMNWYSWGIIRSSHLNRTRLHRIRIVVKFYKHALRLRYGCIPMQYFPLWVLLEQKHSSSINARQQIVVLYKQLSVRTHQTDTSESAFTTARMRMPRAGGVMGIFTRSVLSITSGKILNKNCEFLYWWQTFR